MAEETRRLIAQEGRLSLSHPEDWRRHPALGSGSDSVVIRRASPDGHVLLEVFVVNDEYSLDRWSDLQVESTQEDHAGARVIREDQFRPAGSEALDCRRLVMEYAEPTRLHAAPQPWTLFCFFLRWPGVTILPFFKLLTVDLAAIEPEINRIAASVRWQ